MTQNSTSARRVGAWGTALVLLGAAGFIFGEDAKPAATSSIPLTLSGYTQVYYKHDGTAEVDSFQIRRARIGLSGGLTKDISFKILFDAAKSPYLIDAQVDLALSKDVTLRIGQFKVPFSLESYTSTSDLDTINRTLVVDTLVPGRDIGSSGRDVGAAVEAKWSAVALNVALLNGSGINKADTDEHKDIGGRLVVAPIDELKVGASLYIGETATPTGSVRRDRTGFEAALALDEFSFKGEYIAATDGSLSRNGWYAQGGYFFIPKEVQAVVKFDSYDKNTDFSSDRTDALTLGVNWFFTPKTKLQINYERKTLETGTVLSNGILVQFQVGF